MKKFNILIILAVSIYVMVALLAGGAVVTIQQTRKNDYRIESNRIVEELKQGKEINLVDYSYIKDMSFLESTETNQEKIEEFFIEENKQKNLIQPIFKEGKITNYVKFSYQEVQYPVKELFILFEIILLAMFLFVLAVLLYFKYKVLQPFYRFSTLPEKLAKGHYKDQVKIEKSKYFEQFLLGMSRLKDELEVSKKRQLELLKEKKQLLLSLSHDIKTPLNLIKLYEKSLEENIYPNEEERIKTLQQIGQKTVEIEKYVEEITTSFRDEIIDLPVTVSEIYLEDILNKVFTIYQEQCKLRNINFKIAKYENRLVKADADRIQEVIENLLENAIKYGDGKEISVTFSEEDYCYLIHISNTGNPVLEHELLHLFDSFFRGINAKGKQGSGLGLYIAKQLMRKMDGDIYAENRKNGMMYTIVLR